jgi:hypothetical protein
MIAPLGLRPPHRRMTCRIPEYPYLHEATRSNPHKRRRGLRQYPVFSHRHALARLGPEELEDLLQRYVALLQGIQRPIMLGKPTTPIDATASTGGRSQQFRGISLVAQPIPIAPVVAHR